LVKRLLVLFAASINGLLRIAAAVIQLGVPRYQIIRDNSERFLSTRVVRLIMFGIATLAVLLEYLPDHLPITTLLAIGLLLFLELRAGKITMGITWFLVLFIYEVWIWMALISIPFLAFTGHSSESSTQIASLVHSVAFAYLILDMSVIEPPQRRRRRAKSRIAWPKLGEGFFNPLPAPVPVSTR